MSTNVKVYLLIQENDQSTYPDTYWGKNILFLKENGKYNIPQFIFDPNNQLTIQQQTLDFAKSFVQSEHVRFLNVKPFYDDFNTSNDSSCQEKVYAYTIEIIRDKLLTGKGSENVMLMDLLMHNEVENKQFLPISLFLNKYFKFTESRSALILDKYASLNKRSRGSIVM